jgi:type IV fimbrial biogenesis protein FimT
MRQAEGISTPFIGLYIPLIGRPRPHVGPSIGYEKPSVKNYAFSGFTLIELITTLVIAAILMTLAAPSFSNFVKNNRLTTQANELLADLAFARSEGVKQGANITVCKSTDGLTCDAGAAWNDGWIVITAAGQVLRAHEALSGQNTMVGTANSAPGLTDRIVYDRTGRANNLLVAEEFRLCDYTHGPTQGRWIQVAVTGRARIAIDANTSRPTPPPMCSP